MVCKETDIRGFWGQSWALIAMEHNNQNTIWRIKTGECTVCGSIVGSDRNVTYRSEPNMVCKDRGIPGTWLLGPSWVLVAMALRNNVGMTRGSLLAYATVLVPADFHICYFRASAMETLCMV